MNLKLFLLSMVLISLTSCGGEEKSKDTNSAKADFKAEKNLVDTIILKKVDFYREVVGNGVLKATKRADLRFGTSGEIAEINIENGSLVKKGDVIASLDRRSLALSLEQSQQNLEKAELDLKDNLIGYGYGSDTLNIPKEMIKISKIRSGYSAALHNYKVAKFNYDNARIIAPFSGIVANLTAKPYEQSADIFCTLLDNSNFNVEFNLLESELPFVQKGQVVAIKPYINLTKEYQGVVTNINPIVDENGQIKVTSSIGNIEKGLIEGMNVKLSLKNLLKNQLSVPKTAVVMRDGFDVIFTFNPEKNKASWVYVDVLISNTTHHIIQPNKDKFAELNEGNSIIISGNLNLADNSQVEIRK